MKKEKTMKTDVTKISLLIYSILLSPKIHLKKILFEKFLINMVVSSN
jgi:hypothetical protein